MVTRFPSSTRTELLDLLCSGVAVGDSAPWLEASHGNAKTWWRQSGLMTVSRAVSTGLAIRSLPREGKTSGRYPWRSGA